MKIINILLIGLILVGIVIGDSLTPLNINKATKDKAIVDLALEKGVTTKVLIEQVGTDNIDSKILKKSLDKFTAETYRLANSNDIDMIDQATELLKTIK